MKKKLLKISLLFFSFFALTKSVSAQLSFSISSIAATSTSPDTLVVTTNNFTQIVGIQGSINWDNTILTYSNIIDKNPTLSGLTSNASVSGSTGRLSYIWTDASVTPQTLPSGSVLFKIVFNLATVVPTTTTIAFSNTPTPLQAADQTLSPVSGVVYNSGSITIVPAVPMRFGSFSASRNNSSVKLNWTGYSEQDVLSYEIQRSANGTEFNTVGKINVNNNSSVSNYDFTDNFVSTENCQYRIKAQEKSGKYFFSNILLVKGDRLVKGLMLSPNPVVNNVTMQVNVTSDEMLTIKIIDVTGRIVLEKNHQVLKGQNSININTTSLKSGTYYLVCNSLNTTEKATFIK